MAARGGAPGSIAIIEVALALVLVGPAWGCDDRKEPDPALGVSASLPAPSPAPVPGARAAGEANSASAAALPHAPAAAAAPASTDGDSRAEGGEDTSYLLSQLRNAPLFRVRVAAALALGRRRGPRVEKGLIEALGDDHPAVRTAAASALSRSGSAAASQALKRAQEGEPDEKVARAFGRAQQAQANKAAPAAGRSSSGGLYLSLSRVRAQGALDASLLERADAAARSRAAGLGSALLAPIGETSAAAQAVLSREARTGYQLEVTVGLEEVDGGTRATANVLVATYPGRSIRGSAKGAATAQGDPRSPELQRMAIEHAIGSAFASLPRMLVAESR
jgi:hypothetical protein